MLSEGPQTLWRLCLFTGFGYCKSPTIPLSCRIRRAGWNRSPDKHGGWWWPFLPFCPDTAMQRATGCPFQAWPKPLSPCMAGQTLLLMGWSWVSPALREDRKSRGCPWGPLLGWPVAQFWKLLAGSRHCTGRGWQGPRIGKQGLRGRGWGESCGLKGLGGRRCWVLGAGTDTGCARSSREGGTPAACPHHCPEAPAN